MSVVPIGLPPVPDTELDAYQALNYSLNTLNEYLTIKLYEEKK